ncbi:MAG: hypothetical protein WBW16_01415 [Bacteroidota bacterium]
MQYNIVVSQAYLEMARSYVDALAHSTTADPAAPPKGRSQQWATTTFAFASLTTVCSYMAVEAFTNHELYEIWHLSRLSRDQAEQMKRDNVSIIPTYDRFYKEYGHVDEFVKLKDHGLSDLKDRMKTVWEAEEIPPMHEKNKVLWDQFLDLVERARHFLIHPFPDQMLVQKISERLFWTEPYVKHPQLASDVIGYSFKEAGRPLPEYLSRNRLFKISGIEILF